MQNREVNRPSQRRQMRPMKLLLCLGIICVAMAGSVSSSEAEILSLQQAVKAAQHNDPWLVQNKHSQNAVEAKSVAAGTMPDPTISLGLANFPTDTFAIDQEPMTQVKVGVTQMIPRGDSLRIRRSQLKTMGSQFPHQRTDRRAKTAVTVGQLWLDVYKTQESIVLIEKDRPLFEKLADVAVASYSTAIGRTRQQDIIRAQLELTRLDDRLTMLRQNREMVVEELAGWFRGHFRKEYLIEFSAEQVTPSAGFKLPGDLPQIVMLEEALYSADKKTEPAELFEYFKVHPAVKAKDRKIDASKLGIDLARESYKPMWGVNASYGYRDDGGAMGDRADFVSIGVSFDLPVFTKNRQDKDVESAVSQAEAVKTEKWALVRNMIADFEKNKARLNRLNERQRLFQEQLLPQMYEQAEASLTAYTNDDGDFAEVVRAKIAELNARIDALDIDVEKQKTIIRLNYFFMKDTEDIVTSRK